MSDQAIDLLVKMLSERDEQLRDVQSERDFIFSKLANLEQEKRPDLSLSDALEVIEWATGSKIYKTKALRTLIQIDLKAAKDAIENRFFPKD